MAEQVTYRQIQLSARYSSVLFPFDTIQFLRLLENNSFLLIEQLAEIPIGGRLEVGGIIARKGSASINIDTNKMVLGVAGATTVEVADELDRLESLLQKEFGFDGATRSMFYEFIVNCSLKGRGNMVETMGLHFAETPMLKKLSGLIGKDVSVFAARLGAKGISPNDPNWFDFQIEPMVAAPSDHYQIRVVYRNAHRGDVFSFVRKFDASLRGLREIIE